MARVVLTTTLGNRFASGETEFELPAANVRELLRELDTRFPGLGTEIEQAQLLAIDGEIFQVPYMQRLKANAEVFVLPKIGGG